MLCSCVPRNYYCVFCFVYGFDPFLFGRHVVFVSLPGGGMTDCLAHSSELLHPTFCFLLGHCSWHPTHHWCVRCVYMCVCPPGTSGYVHSCSWRLTMHGLTCCWWTGYGDPGGAVGLVFCHALMLLFFLIHAGSVVVGRFAVTLLAVGSALYAFRVVILCHPPPRRLCGCWFGLYRVTPIFCCVSHCCCPGL